MHLTKMYHIQKSLSVGLCVCLTTRISQKPRVQTLPNFPRTLPVTVAVLQYTTYFCFFANNVTLSTMGPLRQASIYQRCILRLIHQRAARICRRETKNDSAGGSSVAAGGGV